MPLINTGVAHNVFHTTFHVTKVIVCFFSEQAVICTVKRSCNCQQAAASSIKMGSSAGNLSIICNRTEGHSLIVFNMTVILFKISTVKKRTCMEDGSYGEWKHKKMQLNT